MKSELIVRVQQDFNENYAVYWNSFSRLANLLIISNFSLFFLTELVTRERYYYTYYSLGLLFVVHIALLLPLGLLNRIWFYLFCLALHLGAIYFFAVSVWYWVVTNVR
jgi:hypothetical protein